VGFISTVSAYAFYSRDLDDPQQLFANLGFEQPSIVHDRTGEIELARFGVLRRELVKFADIPPEMVDATTAIEDKDFWTNPGFDVGAIVSAGLDTLAGRPRGASTITQQLVRARLLDEEDFQGTVYDRKIREIIQSIRLTQAFPGEQGKKDIMTAYLNQNFYGNQSYGVKAAAIGYFGKDLSKLSLAQFAILAAIPKSPTDYDLMRNALADCTAVVAEDEECPADQVTLTVPDTTEIVQRRNQVLSDMKTRSVLTKGKYTDADFDAAMEEPVVLSTIASPPWKAPHFVWQVREQLGTLLCGAENADNCEAVDTGGYQVTTTVDMEMQAVVEKWLYAAARAPLAKSPERTRAILEELGIPKRDWGWILNLRGKDIHNTAGAVIDYRTGEVLAVGGSASYYLSVKDKKFSPQHDVMFDAWRQPGSSIKPISYITGLDDKTMNAATMFMDVVTEFENNWTPADADKLERGPVRMRPALQFSLNIPAIKSLYINGLDHLFAQFKKFGLEVQEGTQPTPAMAIGTMEVHMIDLLGAYGAIANQGVLMPQQVILEVKDHEGKVVYPTSEETPVGQRVASPQASYIISDILEGNTISSVNRYWAAWAIEEDGKRRPAAYKTGTTDENKDIDAFGYVAPPEDPEAPALAVGVWMGNSDATAINPVTSVASSAPLWSHIMTEVSKGTGYAKFPRPDGLVRVKVDAFSGLLPGPGTVQTVEEWFIEGSENNLRRDDMHSARRIDSATGRLWRDGCTGPPVDRLFLDFDNVESQFPRWQRFNEGWAARAARGPGVRGGPDRTPTAYFFDGFLTPFGRTWGGRFPPSQVCTAQPQVCPPEGSEPTPEPTDAVPCVTEPPPPTEEPTEEPTDPGPAPTKTPKPTKPPPTLAPSVISPAQAAVIPAAAFPLFIPMLSLIVARLFRPNRRQ
jgi:membrane peptidoglycan carboxypeptidase